MKDSQLNMLEHFEAKIELLYRNVVRIIHEMNTEVVA
jgi:hypothetical protein